MLHWGIIGSGTIAYELAYAIQSVDNNIIEAITSRTNTKAKSFAEAVNVKKVYATHQELLEDNAIDIIYIAVPHHLHAALIKDALKHGKHVLCEKPFTINAAEADEITRLAEDQKLFCMEAFWTRFIPSVEKVKSLLEEGHIGKVRMVRGSFGHMAFSQKELNPLHGEGVILDLGIYPVALTFALFGKPNEIQSSKSLSPSRADIQASIILKYGEGLIANLSCSYVSELDNEYVIYGDKGSIKLAAPMYRSSIIEINYFGGLPKVSVDDNPVHVKNYFNMPSIFKTTPYIKSKVKRYLPSKAKTIFVPFEGSGYQYQIKHVAECIAKGLIKSPVNPLEHTVEVLHILDTVRNSEKSPNPNKENP
ncbi:MAG TPA: Gfo/Idh/MocA family oxidoreductase [Anditalea sp.]|nr:Gfo/Idh/MocA family oxidoreductase [Anditalea sp.]